MPLSILLPRSLGIVDRCTHSCGGRHGGRADPIGPPIPIVTIGTPTHDEIVPNRSLLAAPRAPPAENDVGPPAVVAEVITLAVVVAVDH